MFSRRITLKRIRTTVVAMLAITILLGTAACTSSGSTNEFGKNPATVQSVLDDLNSAQKITLKKAAFSISDNWTVVADGNEIATIKGKNFPVWGDTYSMYALDGTFVAGEQEQVHILTGSKANTYDYEGKASGSIKAQRFSLFYHFNIFNADEKQVGNFEQGFGFSLKGDIKNQSGVTEWRVSKAAFAIGANITLTSKAGADKRVSGLNAIWTAAIVNEVAEADSSSSSSSSGK